MENLLPFITQRICVFYKDEWFADRVYEKFMEDIPAVMISKCSNKRMNRGIYLKGGSSIIFVKAHECAKGYRYSKLIIQNGVDQKFIDCIARPMLTNQNEITLSID